MNTRTYMSKGQLSHLHTLRGGHRFRSPDFKEASSLPEQLALSL